MTPAVGIAVLGGLLLLASSRRSSSATSCDQTPEQTSQARERAALLAWIDCAGRTPEDVAALAALLDRAGRAADARAVRERWNARREVDDAAPDGQLGPVEAATAQRALEGEAPPATVPAAPPRRRVGSAARASGGGVDFDAARRLAPQVARSLRSGGGYRTALERFQRAAGLPVDGLYGPSSRAALRYFGVGDPPPARAAVDAPEVYEPPGKTPDAPQLAPAGWVPPVKNQGAADQASQAFTGTPARPETWERL